MLRAAKDHTVILQLVAIVKHYLMTHVLAELET